MLFDASLNEDGTLTWRVGVIPALQTMDPDHKWSIRVSTLVRRSYPQGVTPPQPTEGRASESDADVKRTAPTLRRRTTHRGDVYHVLDAPRKAQEPSLVVYLQGRPAFDQPAPQAQTWAAVGRQLNCRFIFPAPGDDDHAGSPSHADLLRRADAVRRCVAAEQGSTRPSRVYLLGWNTGALVAHAVWQRDNREFAALAAWSGYFREPAEGPEKTSDRDKRILLFAESSPSPGISQSTARALAWYKSKGYTAVKRFTIDADLQEKVRQMVVEKLVGRQ